ncbi:MAG: hypothetical protein IT497_03090 [Ottowia sp.]|nr:hypothetical protein [Ottowia sp.]
MENLFTPLPDFNTTFNQFLMRNKNQMSGISDLAVPMLSAEQIDQCIAHLKQVDAWLNTNREMLQSSIQALETQRAALLDKAGAAGASALGGAQTASTQATTQADIASAWWNHLQQQFTQIATAVVQNFVPPGQQATSSTPKPASSTATDPIGAIPENIVTVLRDEDDVVGSKKNKERTNTTS